MFLRSCVSGAKDGVGEAGHPKKVHGSAPGFGQPNGLQAPAPGCEQPKALHVCATECSICTNKGRLALRMPIVSTLLIVPERKPLFGKRESNRFILISIPFC